VDDMLGQIEPRQFSEWLAYLKLKAEYEREAMRRNDR